MKTRDWLILNAHRFPTRAKAVVACSKAVGVKERAVRKALQLLEESGEVRSLPRINDYDKIDEAEATPLTKTDIEEKKDGSQDLFSKSPNIKTVEDLLDHFSIDTSIWEVSSSKVTTWQVAMGGEGGPEVTDLFGVKASVRRKDTLNYEEVLELFKEELWSLPTPKYPEIKPLVKSKSKKVMAEVCIPDLHLGLLSWQEETGAAYDIKKAKTIFSTACQHFANKLAERDDISRIYMPVGHDFFNVNSSLNQTKHGTPQDEDDRWQKTFLYGVNMMIEAVDTFRQIAPVEVHIIPGNHDHERIFYAGEVLAAWYRECDDIIINNMPTMRKYIKHGKCLIGATHGSEEKANNLPLILAMETAKMGWGDDAEYREMHLGHLHRSRIKSYIPLDDHNGIRVRIMPTLCSRSAWATSKGYDSIREAKMLLWHKEHGCIEETNFHLSMMEE